MWVYLSLNPEERREILEGKDGSKVTCPPPKLVQV